MSRYESLEKALEGLYEDSFDELPEELQVRVWRAFRSQSQHWNDFIEPILELTKLSFKELPDDLEIVRRQRNPDCEASDLRETFSSSGSWSCSLALVV